MRSKRCSRCLQKRAHRACLADRRAARHRQGDARLSLGALRLAHPDPHAPEVQKATSLAVDPTIRSRGVSAAQAQGDLLVLERGLNEQTGKLYTVIRVEDVRRMVSFFGSTAGEGGWRIAIVDARRRLRARAPTHS